MLFVRVVARRGGSAGKQERLMGGLVRWIVLGLGVAGQVSMGMWAGAARVGGGYQQLERGKAKLAERGEVLLSELNCAACHEAPGGSRVGKKGGPELAGVGARVTPQYLRRFIA